MKRCKPLYIDALIVPKANSKNKFERGQVVHSRENLVILVTGKGWKKLGSSVFAGVVIKSETIDSKEVWPVGMYSDTWNTEAFHEVDLKLSELVADSLGTKITE